MRAPVCAQYVFDRPTFALREEDAPYIDQLNFSFGLLRGGAVSGGHWQHIDEYKAFIARHPHILPVLSVGGWGAGGFSEAASTAEGRARFAQSAADLMERHGFLGLDIDWEYPCRDDAGIAASPDDRRNFTRLLEALRAQLDALAAKDGRPRLLAAAFGAHVRLVGDIECGPVGQLLDQFNLMSYDLQTPGVLSYHAPLRPGHGDCPASAVTALDAFAAAGIPKEKVMIGNAFYARMYEAADPERNVPFAPAKGYLPGLNYRELMRETGWTHHLDTDAVAAFATNGARYATFDTPDTLAAKGAFVRENGLMGMMCWEYGGDDRGTLTRAMYQSLHP